MQRKLKIGYAKTARLLDILEDEAVISPLDISNQRKVLIGPNEEYIVKNTGASIMFSEDNKNK